MIERGALGEPMPWTQLVEPFTGHEIVRKGIDRCLTCRHLIPQDAPCRYCTEEPPSDPMGYDPQQLVCFLPAVDADVKNLSRETRGAYLDLLRLLWTKGPADPEVLRQEIGDDQWLHLWPLLSVSKKTGKASLKWLELGRAGLEKTAEQVARDLAARVEAAKAKFKAECQVVHRSQRILTDAQAHAFFNHWSEAGKGGKLRWEREKTFEIHLRMSRWRDSPYNKEEKKPPGPWNPH